MISEMVAVLIRPHITGALESGKKNKVSKRMKAVDRGNAYH